MKRVIIKISIMSLSSLLLLTCSPRENANNRNAVAESTPDLSSLSPRPTIDRTHPSVPISPTPVPTTSAANATVRLRVVRSDGKPADGVAVAFVENANVNTIPDVVTGDDGNATVEGVPCDKKMVIMLWQKSSFAGTNDMFESTMHTSYVKCGRGINNLRDIRINCVCPDCRPNRVIHGFGGYENQPCKPRNK